MAIKAKLYEFLDKECSITMSTVIDQPFMGQDCLLVYYAISLDCISTNVVKSKSRAYTELWRACTGTARLDISDMDGKH